MSRTFECGDTAALVTYQYGECERDEQAAVAAHLVECVACATEVEALDTTRRQLAAWVPPSTEPGIRSPTDGAVILRPVPWWRGSLPTWVQATGAVALFAGGLALGGAASTWMQPAAPPAEAARSAVVPVSAADLADLERRLQAEIAAVRGAIPAGTDESAMLAAVQNLIRASEGRQRRELALVTAEMLRDFDAQRRVDRAQMERAVGQLEGVTGAEVAEQRRLIDYLIRVAQQQP